MKLGYLIAEGYHEIEVIGNLLKLEKFSRITNIKDLHPYWHRIIPKGYPVAGDLVKRVSCPAFFQNDTFSAAIHSASGLNQVCSILEGTLTNLDTLKDDMTGIGIFIDADFDHRGAQYRFDQIKTKINSILTLPDKPGEIQKSQPNTGVYIFPDNQNVGTLENILTECAKVVYPNILAGATGYVNNLNIDNLDMNDQRDFNLPAGKMKAIVGCIGNVLRPGKAIQVSLQDNKWVSDQTSSITGIKNLYDFLIQLFELSN